MTVSALEGHRIWAASYDTAPNPVLALERRLLAEMFGPLEGRRAVDVACGTGYWAAYLASRGATVCGIDVCREMLIRAQASLAGHVVLGRAEQLPFATASADVLVCSFALGYLAHPNTALREMARVGGRGATLLLSDVHPDGIARGWTRSFHCGQSRYEMEHFAHSLDAIYHAAAAAGLTLEGEQHCRFGEAERVIFESAGKASAFAACAEVPAVWIGKWVVR